MSKGTPSFGKHQKVTHIRCRRCGRHSYHKRLKKCSACGYPRAKLLRASWKWKSLNRKRRIDIRPKHQKRKTTREGRSRKRR